MQAVPPPEKPHVIYIDRVVPRATTAYLIKAPVSDVAAPEPQEQRVRPLVVAGRADAVPQKPAAAQAPPPAKKKVELPFSPLDMMLAGLRKAPGLLLHMFVANWQLMSAVAMLCAVAIFQKKRMAGRASPSSQPRSRYDD